MPNKNGLYCVFFYGTQMLPEVFYSACYGTKNVPEEIKKRHTFRPAILHGYCRRRVEGANYPGIAPDANKNVLGVFATGITEANMKRLDDFEGDEYARKMVTVNVFNKVGNANGKGNAEGFKKTAVVYEFLPGTDDLVQGEWNLEDVRVQILQDFVRG
ncbi:AIG2-like family-domain-containing protein [Chaetomium sp. MPI-CAGE-AT-0009]|nr:AIG2-like family-domain-containing protein [Chaetomium sp. MPI-CAGE-AT-0009]